MQRYAITLFPFLAVSHTIPAAGAVNPAGEPASRKVKHLKNGEKEDDDDDDDDDDDEIEVLTGAGTSSLSFMNSP